MSSSSSRQSDPGQAKASSSRPAPPQPLIEDGSDEEGDVMASDPLEGSFPEQ